MFTTGSKSLYVIFAAIVRGISHCFDVTKEGTGLLRISVVQSVNRRLFAGTISMRTFAQFTD